MEVLHTRPSHDSFTPLSTHQSQTPESFFSGPPVLHHHSPSATLSFHKSDLDAAPAFAGLAAGAQVNRSANGTTTAVNGHSHEEEAEDEEDEELEIAGVDIWATSDRFTLYSPFLSTGLSIPYPSISLHAIQPASPTRPHASLFLQLLPSAHTFDDHDPDSTISMTITPAPAPAGHTIALAEETEQQRADTTTSASRSQTPAQSLYSALSACANLHPDPLSGSDADMDDQGQAPGVGFEGDHDVSGVYPLSSGGDGSGHGLPPPMPGSGGWITAENVGEFFDEEGNWRGRERGDGEGAGVGVGLGAGAGSVRMREDGEAEGEGDGEEEETKWRRTG